jgi:uncharacterized protein involved in type VI secretion and phage assembly
VNEQAIVELVDRLRNRFYGKYRGTVTDVEAGGRGRIKAMVPAVLGTTVSGWCSPCVPYAGPNVGFAFLPEVGAGVWIEFEGGDVSYPIWSGCYWRDGEIPQDATATKKVLRTASGHEIALDDEGSSITITDANGNTITMDSSGITLVSGGSKVVIDSGKVDINGGGLEVSA